MPDQSRALVIAHYHWRSGGVRRVVDAGVGDLVEAGRFDRVILLGGEHSDDGWEGALAIRLGGVPMTLIREPALRYSSEQRLSPKTIERRCREALEFAVRTLDWDHSLIWVHNIALARNIPFGRALRHVGLRTGIPIAAHHHDFWFENRWSRWREMLAAGISRVDEAANPCFLPQTRTAHITINRLDAEHLRLPGKVWVPNPVGFRKRPNASSVVSARRWLSSVLGNDAPVWLSATRLLRRKNLAEGLLLTRWVRPDAWFVTTAGPSSADEEEYGRRLIEAATKQRWKAKFGLLAGLGGRHPAIDEIQSAAEALMLTSVQEGFGLAFLEAASLQVPLIARRLANVQPDLDHLGVHIPHLYDEVRVPLSFFDVRKERQRREIVWKKWRQTIPLACRRFVARCPDFDTAAEPFSRLTFEAQLEVLQQDPAAAYSAALPFNKWMKGLLSLRAPSWKQTIDRILEPKAFARRVLDAVASVDQPVMPKEAAVVQSELIQQRLRSEFLYPLLMQ